MQSKNPKTENMENLLVKLPKTMIAQIDLRVQSGYGSRAEVIREAMRRLLAEK